MSFLPSVAFLFPILRLRREGKHVFEGSPHFYFSLESHSFVVVFLEWIFSEIGLTPSLRKWESILSCYIDLSSTSRNPFDPQEIPRWTDPETVKTPSFGETLSEKSLDKRLFSSITLTNNSNVNLIL